MVTQYSLDSFDHMCAVADGAYVTVGDYDDLEERHDALKEQHDTFVRDVRRTLVNLLSHYEGVDTGRAITDVIDNLEAAFMAEAHPQDAR